MPTTSLSRRGWLCLPPLACYVVDISMTLAGQESRYWEGDYSAAIERNPLAWPLLAWHPLAFGISAVIWGMIFTSLILCWRSRLAVLIAFILTVGHVIGAASWMFRYGAVGWAAAIAFILAARVLWTVAWRRSGLAQREP